MHTLGFCLVYITSVIFVFGWMVVSLWSDEDFDEIVMFLLVISVFGLLISLMILGFKLMGVI